MKDTDKRQTPITDAYFNNEIGRPESRTPCQVMKYIERQLAEARHLIESSKRARQSLSDACDHLQRQLAEVRKDERELSEAYLRIREKLKAWNTPIAPTSKQVWDHTEACLDSLIEQRDALAEALRDMLDLWQKIGGNETDWAVEKSEAALAAVERSNNESR